jgi:hypothetical protein
MLQNAWRTDYSYPVCLFPFPPRLFIRLIVSFYSLSPSGLRSSLVSVLTSTNDLWVSSARLADGSTCHARLDPAEYPQ